MAREATPWRIAPPTVPVLSNHLIPGGFHA